MKALQQKRDDVFSHTSKAKPETEGALVFIVFIVHMSSNHFVQDLCVPKIYYIWNSFISNKAKVTK